MTTMECDDTLLLLRDFPKVELHAHLNGSIREVTLFELAKERKIKINEHYFEVSSMCNSSKNDVKGQQQRNHHRRRSLMECFDIFAEIGKVIVDLDAIQRITKEALEDFAEQSVAYLELRSTPKRLMLHNKHDINIKSNNSNNNSNDKNILASKRQYCETVIDTILNFRKNEEERYAKEMEDYNAKSNGNNMSSLSSSPRLPMMVSFLVSVDRSNTVKEGTENIDLAIELAKEYPDVVRGVDLGGNPLKRCFLDFKECCFDKARQSGLLKVTLHCAEVPCTDNDQQSPAYNDALSILDYKPDRLGHALILPPTLQHKLLELKIFVESCPTSNVLTTELVFSNNNDTSNSSTDATNNEIIENNDDDENKNKFISDNSSINIDKKLIDGVKRHPQLQNWIKNDHPFCICTDDPGVFNTNATQEYILLHKAFGLQMKDFKNIVLNAVDHTFANKETKRILRSRLETKLACIP